MWYPTNPDYDITRLICSYISLNWGYRYVLKGYFTSLKNPFRKHSSKTNLFPFTVSDKNKSVEKSEVWTMKCEGTVAQSGRESWVQMESNQLVLVEPIYYKSGFVRFYVPEFDF